MLIAFGQVEPPSQFLLLCCCSIAKPTTRNNAELTESNATEGKYFSAGLGGFLARLIFDVVVFMVLSLGPRLNRLKIQF
jgi:hypothetical protein